MGAAYLRGATDPTDRIPCDKVGYASRTLAQRALKTIRKPDQGGLRVYCCQLCHLWHHGHVTPRKIRRAMVRKARPVS